MTTKPINRDPLADLNMGQGPYVLPQGSRHEPDRPGAERSEDEPTEDEPPAKRESHDPTEDAEFTI